MAERRPDPDLDGGVAIVGMACIFPGAGSLDAFWSNVRDGVDSVSDVPDSRWDPVFAAAAGSDASDRATGSADRFGCRRGGFVDDVARFDPAPFGIMPVVVDGAEPDQLLALRVAAAALADAGDAPNSVAPERAGVLLGRGGYRTAGVARLDQRVHVAQQLAEALRALCPDLDEDRIESVRTEFQDRLGPARPEAAIGLVPNLAASRIANRLDLRGPAYTVDAACASSLIAVDQACAELRSGRCDLVLAGGVHHCHDVTIWSVFNQLRALSPTGVIRPFGRDADGIVIGEGTGVVVLKRAIDAERDGDRVYAVIRGTGVASDGRDASLMSPGVEGQVAALEQAWSTSGLDPETVGLVEGHGTATPTGDAVELDTLRRVFGKDDRGRATAVLGSVKSMIGHAMPAAGAAGLIKTALAIHHGVLPPTLHAEQAHPALGDTRFRLLDRAEPWEQDTRLGAVNAFGFGGINAHVVLESWPGAPRPLTGVTAPSATAIAPLPSVAAAAAPTSSGAGEGCGPALVDLPGGPLLRLAAPDVVTLLARLDAATSRDTIIPVGDGPARVAVLAPNERRLTLARRALERGEPWRGRNDVWFEPVGLLSGGPAGDQRPEGKLAFLFPGVEPVFEPRIDDVAERFGHSCSWGREGASELETQALGIIAVGRLLHGVLADMGIEPDVIAGHSLGEWCGEIAAGMVPDDVVDTFIERMRPGSIEVSDVTFLALGCGVEVADDLISGLDGVAVSHDNCPHQSVVCGAQDQIAVVADRARPRQVFAQELPFRSGFHSPAFAPHLPAIGRELGELPLRRPTVPLWSATTGAPYPEDPDDVRALATRHLVEPVRFRHLVERLHDDGVRVFVQVGVGSLTGFVDDTLRDRPHLTVAANASKAPGLDQLARVAASVWVEGGTVDLASLTTGAPLVADAPARRSATTEVPLRLGTSLVRDLTPLDPSPLDRTARAVRPAYSSDLGVPADHPLLADLRSIGEDILAASDAVLEQWAVARSDRPAGPAHTEPVPQSTSPPAAAPDSGLVRELTFSLDVEPAWEDHAFFRQADGWSPASDRFPLVPMTGILEILADLANEVHPNLVAVALEDVRAFKWLRVDPPVTVTARATPLTDDDDDGGPYRVRVSLDGHARATVVLAERWADAPAPRSADFAEPRAPEIDAAELYERRWMFHGPRYQGIRAFGALGRDGIAGVIESLPAPGALLDNAGQLIGCWMQQMVADNRLALPVAIDRIEYFGPHPESGVQVDTVVWIRDLQDDRVVCDLELSVPGPDGSPEVWCRIDAWHDRRFGTTPKLFEALRWPERYMVAEHAGTDASGAFLVARETWSDSALRDVMMRRYLTVAEQERYEGHHPNAQRQFLLGRIAAKDAVRWALHQRDPAERFPAEVEVRNDDGGRPTVHAPSDRDLRVSIAHTTGLGVALVAEGNDPGIDVERVDTRSDRFVEMVLTEHEAGLAPPPRYEGRVDAWRTAMWSAKEAVAKSTGRGLQGRPKDFEIESIEGDDLRVCGRIVHLDRLIHEGEEYVVAWTIDQ